MRPFVARYDGPCGLCDVMIYGEDEEIVEVDGEPVHLDCALDEGHEIEWD